MTLDARGIHASDGAPGPSRAPHSLAVGLIDGQRQPCRDFLAPRPDSVERVLRAGSVRRCGLDGDWVASVVGSEGAVRALLHYLPFPFFIWFLAWRDDVLAVLC